MTVEFTKDFETLYVCYLQVTCKLITRTGRNISLSLFPFSFKELLTKHEISVDQNMIYDREYKEIQNREVRAALQAASEFGLNKAAIIAEDFSGELMKDGV